MPSRDPVWARLSRMLVVVAAAIGLFSVYAASCCTLDQAHHTHHHHVAAGTACPDGGTCGDTSHHSECCDETAGLWTRAADGHDPLLATAPVVAVMPDAPRPTARSAPPPSPRVPCRGDRVALCVLRI
ncbi:hypothetical protein [Microtetraspora niveoalba]|uniref:hypothetical protein n=1 Tax=Microtetraspora niveoalba TaxID=46175 RepID=UPI000836BD1A|nr:hypothetical protein [Microtetraspora niveoalba]